MNNISIILLLTAPLFFVEPREKYNGSSTAPVILAGSIVKNFGNEPVKKYSRKNCPVCKGTGKYLSGDQIKTVDCGYCEIDKKMGLSNPNCKCIECNCDKCNCLKINKL